MKYKLEATIPSGPYGNLKPSFEITELQQESEVMETLARLWNTYGDKPMQSKTSSGGVKITTFTGEEVMWNEATHKYTDLDGKVLLSGSKYAAEHSPAFPKEAVMKKASDSWDVPVADIDDIWSRKGDASLDLGNAVHKAMELYHLHHGTGAKIMENSKAEENYALPKQPYLKRLVLDFIEKFGADAYSEVVVSDTANGMAGTIDRLSVVDAERKICVVGDYKSNTEIKKPKLLEYQKQLSYYAHILINHGWTVQHLELFKLDDEEKWERIEMEVLDLE